MYVYYMTLGTYPGNLPSFYNREYLSDGEQSKCKFQR